MTTDRLKNWLSIAALLISLSSLALSCDSSLNAKDALTQTRSISVLSLKNKIMEENALALTGLDAVSSNADLLLEQMEEVATKCKRTKADPRYHEHRKALESLVQLVKTQTQVSARINTQLESIQIGADYKQAEANLTKLLGSVRETSVHSLSKAWDADLKRADRFMTVSLARCSAA